MDFSELRFYAPGTKKDISPEIIDASHGNGMCAVRSVVMASLQLNPDLNIDAKLIWELEDYREANSGGDGNSFSELSIRDDQQIVGMFNLFLSPRVNASAGFDNQSRAKQFSYPFRNTESPRDSLKYLIENEPDLSFCISYIVRGSVGHIVHLVLDENRKLKVTSDKIEDEGLATHEREKFNEMTNSGDFCVYVFGPLNKVANVSL
ncbi:MAG TPA: hypothetical protein ENI23_14405 [bacterium]|nr:hypothetical protein [bacterium]